MAHFSEIKKSNNEVIRIVAIYNSDVEKNGGEFTEQVEQWVYNFLPKNQNEETYWKQTSLHTYGNQYWMEDENGIPILAPQDQQHKAKRKNHGKPGFIYDSQNDAFIPPQPFSSWTLNTQNYLWEAPVAKPTEEQRNYNGIELASDWEESSLTWIGINPNDLSKYIWNPNTLNWSPKN
jgi:hypothetical protein